MSDETAHERAQSRGLSRRRLMQGAAAVGVAAWIPFEQIPAAQSALPTPPSFPGGIPLFQQSYKNWSGAISTTRPSRASWRKSLRTFASGVA